MDQRQWRNATAALAAMSAVSGCGKPKAAEWLQVTQGDPCAAAPAAGESAPCDAPVFYLDTANVTYNAGTPYIILQTRYADGRVGSIRAEVNCRRQVVEPTALKEALQDANGALVANRTTNLSAEDERALLQRTCPAR